MRKRMMIFTFLLLSSIGFSHAVHAHADLVTSTPQDGSVLDESPSEVVLLFSGPIDETVYEFNVVNELGSSILSGDPYLNTAGTELRASIKSDEKGKLTVTYSVISKDGHPIEGKIHFTVNEPDTKENKRISPFINKDLIPKDKFNDRPITIHNESLQDATTSNLGMVTPLSSIIKSFYLLSLLLLTGSLIWTFLGIRVNYLPQMQLVHLGLLALFSWSQARSFLSVFDTVSWSDLFLKTDIGQFWTGALVITVLGLYILGRNGYVDLFWVALILLFKSLNSHAIATTMPPLTVGLNLIHLLFSGLWVAGLFLIVTKWKSAETKAFIPRFSRTALISLLALSVTGSVYAIILAPSLSVLWTTPWGYMLLAKLLTVIGVFTVGGFIRREMKKHHTLHKNTFVFVDATLAITILLLVGVLTQLSPSL